MDAFLCAVGCLFLFEYLYSGTPPYGHPLKATIDNIANTSLGLNAFTYVCAQSNVETPVFRNENKFYSLNSTWTVQNLLNNPDACLPHL